MTPAGVSDRTRKDVIAATAKVSYIPESQVTFESVRQYTLALRIGGLYGSGKVS
jgi:hypothetical protein